MAERQITVEVVFAGTAEWVERRPVEVSMGCTVMQAVLASGIAQFLPAEAIDPARLGIFACKVAPDQLVRDGDRIEIYRPLVLDPMESRRRRSR
ncbi:MAG: RnfH family protein [Rhodanobacter sp.]